MTPHRGSSLVLVPAPFREHFALWGSKMTLKNRIQSYSSWGEEKTKHQDRRDNSYQPLKTPEEVLQKEQLWQTSEGMRTGTERRRDGETERQRDGETGRRKIGNSFEPQICHSHYSKLMASKYVTLQYSAMPYQSKMSILIADLVRIIRNVSVQCKEEERSEKVQD